MNDNKHAGRTAGRYLKAMAIAGADPVGAAGFADGTRWLDANQIKAAANAMTTTSAGGSLAGEVGLDFVSLVYPQTILGRMKRVRNVPFDTKLIRQTTGASAHWVAEAAPKPLTYGGMADDGALPARKLIAISVISKELARLSDESIFTADLSSAAVAAMDGAFADPANAGVTGEKPAGVANGITATTATDNPVADIKALVAAYTGDLLTSVWVMHPNVATSLALRGAPFDSIHALGGTLLGLPVLTSKAAKSGTIQLIDERGIEVAGTGEAELSATTEATIQMSDDPDSPPDASTVMTSLWQMNLVGLRAELITNWRLARTGAVAWISGISEY